MIILLVKIDCNREDYCIIIADKILFEKAV